MGPAAATLAVEALKPSAKSARPVLDPGTLARMRTASDAYADAQGDEDLDELADLDELDADELVKALGSLMAAAGIDPGHSPQDLLERLKHLPVIQPDVWLGIMEEHLGWRFADVGAFEERDGGQVAVALGSGHRRLPVFVSAVSYVPGDLGDEQVASLKARIAAEHPAGAVLIFNQPVGWLPKHRRGGLVYGGLLWSDNAWSDFVLRPRGGLDDALAQRGRDIARPDADTVKALGFADARALLRSLAAYVAGLEPEDATVEFLQTSGGWIMPLVTPL